MNDESREHADLWWRTPEARALSNAESAVEDALSDWQAARQRGEKRVVREWELSPHAPVFASHRDFLTALANEVSELAEVKDAWLRFREAVLDQHQALLAWIDEMGADGSIQ